jgi:hypothetical protein
MDLINHRAKDSTMNDRDFHTSLHTAAVTRGAEFLDRAFPGWEARVNLDDLNMASADHCIAGQVFGDYVALETRYGMDLTERRERGFTGGPHDSFDDLCAAWTALILNRRGSEPQPETTDYRAVLVTLNGALSGVGVDLPVSVMMDLADSLLASGVKF